MSAFHSAIGKAALVLLCVGAAACSDNQSAPRADNMPLRSIRYFVDNPQETKKMRAECERWAATSARLADIPVVVLTNCSRANEAHASLTTPRPGS